MIEVQASDPTGIVIRIADALDMTSVPHFLKVVDDACGPQCRSLAIDLTACPFIDSTAISSFIKFAKRGFESFEVVISPTGPVHRVLDICGFTAGGTFVRIAEN